MKERRYSLLGDPLLHLMIIGAAVAMLGLWRSSLGRPVPVIGPNARVINYSAPTPPPLRPAGATAPTPPAKAAAL
jgi:hypothetical protein